MTAVERAEARLTLLKEAEELADQLRTNQAERTSLLDRRAVQCRQLREAGATIQDLQDVFGLRRSRIQQILRMPHD